MDNRPIVQRSSVFRQSSQYDSSNRRINRGASGENLPPIQPPVHPIDPTSIAPVAESNFSVPDSSKLGTNLDRFQDIHQPHVAQSQIHPPQAAQTQVDQSQLDHSKVNHSKVNHSQAAQTAIAQTSNQTFNQTSNQTSNLTLRLLGWNVHPYGLVIVVWLLSLAIAGISFLNMIKVDPSFNTTTTTATSSQPGSPNVESAQAPNSEALPNLETDLTVAAEEKGTLPLFSLGAVAFSCAVGCLLMSRRSKPDATLIKRSRSSSGVRRLPRQTSLDAQPTHETRNHRVDDSKPSTEENHASAANVTVVSSEQSHPLDWDEPSIADNLDLRQTRPVSYWL